MKYIPVTYVTMSLLFFLAEILFRKQYFWNGSLLSNILNILIAPFLMFATAAFVGAIICTTLGTKISRFGEDELLTWIVSLAISFTILTYIECKPRITDYQYNVQVYDENDNIVDTDAYVDIYYDDGLYIDTIHWGNGLTDIAEDAEISETSLSTDNVESARINNKRYYIKFNGKR